MNTKQNNQSYKTTSYIRVEKLEAKHSWSPSGMSCASLTDIMGVNNTSKYKLIINYSYMGDTKMFLNGASEMHLMEQTKWARCLLMQGYHKIELNDVAIHWADIKPTKSYRAFIHSTVTNDIIGKEHTL